MMLKSLIRNLKGTLTMAGATINTILCFIPLIFFAILKLLIPFKAFRVLMTRWIMAIGEVWIDVNAAMFSAVNSTQWDLRSDHTLSPDKWYLIIVNHQTWVDIVVLQTLFNRKIPFLKFFIKQELIWFPFLGVAWWAMDMPFMKRYTKSYLARHPEKKGQDLEATKTACEKFRETPTSVINFIEGTRFSEEKKRKRGSSFQYLLPPRAGGVALALSSMGNMFDAILDITVVYPGGSAPRFWQMACGELDHVVVDVQQLEIDDWMLAGDYSTDREYRRRFHRWLSELWLDKDERIGAILEENAGT